MDVNSSVSGSDKTLSSNGMNRSHSISYIASSNSHRSVFNHETILRLVLDNILKKINYVYLTKRNDLNYHTDNNEGFTAVKPKKCKSKKTGIAADKSVKIPRINSENHNNDVEILSADSGLDTETSSVKDKNPSQEILRKMPKPIMVTEFPNIIQFLNELSSNDKFKFAAKHAGDFIKLSPETILYKNLLHAYFKQSNVQHYIIREIPLKAFIRGFPRTFDIESVRETLACRGFIVPKLSKMKSRRDGKLLPL